MSQAFTVTTENDKISKLRIHIISIGFDQSVVGNLEQIFHNLQNIIGIYNHILDITKN